MECQGHTLNEGWENAMRLFLDTYTLTIYEGRETAVIYDLVIHIDEPLPEKLHRLCLWKESVKEQYINAIDKPHSGLEIDRLFTQLEQNISQYDLLLPALNNMQTDRPIFVSLCNPILDLSPYHSSPCLTSLEFQKKHDRLDIKAFFSVINLYTHGLLDLNQISYLHNKICQQLSCKIGKLSIYASHSIMNAIDCLICKELINKKE